MGTLPGRGHVRRDARFKPLLGRSAALTWARRLLSVLTLVAIDLASLILGVMAAFAGPFDQAWTTIETDPTRTPDPNVRLVAWPRRVAVRPLRHGRHE